MTAQIRPLTITDAEAFVHLRREALAEAPLAFAASPEDNHASSPAFVSSVLDDSPESILFGAFVPQLVGIVGLYRVGRFSFL